MKKVFIGGCDRSGTTFLAGLLAQYQGVIVGPETQFKREVLRSELEKFDKLFTLEKFIANWRFREWFSDAESVRGAVADADICCYEQLIDFLVEKFSLDNFDVKPLVWVDHTPENFEYYELYSNELSNIKYVHIYRDGRAVASSLMGLEWGPNTPEAAAKFWLEKLSYSFAAQTLQENSVLAVSYESLVLNTNSEISRILDFCEIPREKAKTGPCMLMPGFTLNQHRLVGRASDVERINFWKTQLTDREISIFEYYAGNMLLLLGYDLNMVRDAPRYGLIIDRLYEAISFQINKFRYKKKRGIGNEF